MFETSKKGKFFCSRCKSIYNEGTLRFCTDCGGRLVPAEAGTEKTPQPEGGMFAKILGRQVAESQESSRGDEQAPAPPLSTQAPPTDVEQLQEREVQTREPQIPPPNVAPIEPEVVSSPSLGEPREVSTPLSEPVAPLITQEAEQAGGRTLESEAELPSSMVADEEVATNLFVGKKISERFLVTELLASGAERSTYLAEDVATGQKVLAQTFPADAFDRRPLKEFYADALRKLSRFRDADFASILASGRLPDGKILLVSEFVEGNSLAQVVGFVGHFEALRAARLIRKIADALNEAHQLGVFHGSVRSENIVLLSPDDPQDNLKIIGLGIAFADGDVLGGGVPSAPDDIFDLAIVAFQLLTGKNPFPGLHGSDVLRSGVGISVCTHRPELPKEVDEIISRALSVAGENGFAEIRDFGDALYGALTDASDASVERERTAAQAVVIEADPADETAEEVPDLERIQVRESDYNERMRATDEEAGTSSRRSVEGGRSHSLRLTVMLAFAALLTIAAAVYIGFNWGPVSRSSSSSSPAKVPTEAMPAADLPIAPRDLTVPDGYRLFTNSKDGLSTELSRSFTPFTLHHPQEWEKASSATNFLDVAARNGSGATVEQFLVTSYASDGTFGADRDNFPKLVEKSNREVGALLGNGFRAVSQGETMLQGGRLKAYEVKFVFEGMLGGSNATIWGRRLWIPVQKKGAKHGFVVTMLATPEAPDVKGVDDVGNRGRLKVVLDSFEPLPE